MSLTLAQQHGIEFAAAYEAHYDAKAVIQSFSDAHPLTIPDPAYPVTPDGPRFLIRNPEKHTLRRDGDMLSCIECGDCVIAPVPPRRPLTPQEASLSRFD